MGKWPEFRKCCWCLSLKSGTVAIGSWNLILNAAMTGYYSATTIVKVLEMIRADELHIDFFGYILLSLGIIVYSVQAIIGLATIVGRNKPECLKKVVFYMTVLCLMNLLVFVVGVSTHGNFDSYINAFVILMSGYFILIVRSNQLQLEGRLNNPHLNAGPQTSVEGGTAAYHSNGYNNIVSFHPPPPDYEEATRYGSVYRCDFALTLPPTDEVANEDERDARSVVDEPNAAAVLPVQQAMARPSTSNAPPIKKNIEQEHVIYDEEQFSAISNLQVVERNPANTNT